MSISLLYSPFVASFVVWVASFYWKTESKKWKEFKKRVEDYLTILDEEEIDLNQNNVQDL